MKKKTMTRYIVRRVLLTIPLLLSVSILTFVFINLSPMDPVEVVLHAQGVPQITDELLLLTRAELGMDKPFMVRYLDWLIACFWLDFGNSYVTGQPVWQLLGPAFVNTLKLVLVSIILVVFLSIFFGVICALKEGRWLDKSIRGGAFVFTAIPPYLLAALMTWFFAVELDLLPTSGMDSYASYILPVFVIAVSYAGIYFRIIRSSMISNLSEDYVLYAKASGLPEWRITLHVLKNSLQVVVSVFFMAIPIMLGSTVVVENVFAWPGLGTLSVKSILSRDFPVIEAYVLILAVFFILFNAVSDIVNTMMDPLLRKEN